MKGYLWAYGLGAKDFGCHAEQISKRMKEASLAPLISAGREVRYLNSGKDNKQQIALEIAARDALWKARFARSRPWSAAVTALKSIPTASGPNWRSRHAIGPRTCLNCGTPRP